MIESIIIGMASAFVLKYIFDIYNEYDDRAWDAWRHRNLLFKGEVI